MAIELPLDLTLVSFPERLITTEKGYVFANVGRVALIFQQS